MPASLFDTSVWLAAIFERHPFHSIARHPLQQATLSQPAVFCRATQQSVLRLMSTAGIAKTYGEPPLSNQGALMTLDALQTLPQVAWRDEPAGVFGQWRTLAALDSASPKVWMDAYLAAFAIAGGLRLVTLDRDFKILCRKGLIWPC
ncbi:MAG: TA system VapC family ribonuclease toxin [Pseudomonadota bacterium]